MWLAQPLPTARGTRFAVQVTSPIVSFNLCTERSNKWLGTPCMACRPYAFIQLIYSCSPRAFILFNSLETLAFRIVLVYRCAHDQQRQRNAHQCFQLGDANCFERVDALRGACYVGVSIQSCMTSFQLLCGLHVDSMLSSTPFLKPLLAT